MAPKGDVYTSQKSRMFPFLKRTFPQQKERGCHPAPSKGCQLVPNMTHTRAHQVQMEHPWCWTEQSPTSKAKARETPSILTHPSCHQPYPGARPYPWVAFNCEADPKQTSWPLTMIPIPRRVGYLESACLQGHSWGSVAPSKKTMGAHITTKIYLRIDII